MDKLGDIELFVNVVKQKGLAAAGRKLGMSPASVTARLNRLESTYGVRLLTRTTRQVSLTDEGASYYQDCLALLGMLDRAEEGLYSHDDELKGSLRVTAPVDIGKQVVANALADFVSLNPGITAHLHLGDHIVNLVADDYDLAVRFGGLTDNRMIARKLCGNKRVLFSSPEYVEKYAAPELPHTLIHHKCLALERADISLNTWHFEKDGVKSSVVIAPALTTNDGSMIRDWVIKGAGIGLKSYWDIKNDLDAGRLVLIMEDYNVDYFSNRTPNDSGLYAVYPSKSYLPVRVSRFIDLLKERFNELG
jgi:DNA-binding transcriptional LysR family regulator